VKVSEKSRQSLSLKFSGAISKIQKKLDFTLILSVFLGLLISIPILQTPLSTDDIWFSILQSYNSYYSIEPLQYISEKFVEFKNIGRLNPVGNFIQFLTTYFMLDRLWYKTYLILINFLVAFFIRRLMIILSRNRKSLPNLAFLIFLLVGQIRNFYDPRTQLSGTMQITIIFLLQAMTYYHKIISEENEVKNKTLFLVYSLLSFYTYDLTFFILFPFLLLFSLRIFIDKKMDFPRKGLLKIYLVLLWFQYLVMLLVRYSAPILLDDSKLNLSVMPIIKTFKTQLFGSLPTTLFESKGVTNFENISLAPLITFIVFGSLIAVLMLKSLQREISLVSTRRSEERIPNNEIHSLTLFSLSMIFVPVIITSVSPRFQVEVKDGLPYIGFYYQQVGLVILASLLIARIKVKESFGVFFLTILMAFWFGAITLASNYNLVREENQTASNMTLSQKTLGWERELVESGAKFGAFDYFDKESVFSFMPQFAWTTTEYLTMLSKKNISVSNSPTWWNNTMNPVKNVCTEDNCTQYSVFSIAKDYTSGYLAIGRMKNSNDNFMNLKSGEWYMYIKNYPEVKRNSPCLRLDNKNVILIEDKDFNVLKSDFQKRDVLIALKLDFEIDSSHFSFCK
jgi:hypothetical protein